MDWITDEIAVGGLRDAIDWQYLQAEGVEAILQLCYQDRLRVEFPCEVLRLEVRDGAPLPEDALEEGVSFIRAQQVSGRKTLVCCGAGMSRSATFVAAYLHEEGMDLTEAYQLIIRKRPIVMPNPKLVRSLIEYYGLPDAPEEVLVKLARYRREPGAG